MTNFVQLAQLMFCLKTCMGKERMDGNEISAENIEKRTKALNDNKENKIAKMFNQIMNKIFYKVTPFVKEFNFEENKTSLEEDFIFFHFTVEGKLFY